MTTREYDILKILADGETHSGEELAEKTGITRAAIWKQISKIREKKIIVAAVKGKGYQLSQPVELLDLSRILHAMGDGEVGGRADKLDIFYSIGSTNQYLLDELNSRQIHRNVVLAEHQTHGRGRSNHRWQSGLGAGIYLSVGWHYELMPGEFPALSLAVGTVIARLLSEITGKSIGRKWPNDLVYDGAKLGGILIESRGQHAGTMDMVIGIGLNVSLSQANMINIDQKIIDIHTITGRLPGRNDLAGKIISNILILLAKYPSQGFKQYLSEWRERDIARGKKAKLYMGGDVIEGTIVDVDEEGNLIMDINGSFKRFTGGELSLRISS